MAFVFLFASIFCAVCGQLLLKATVTRLDGVDITSAQFGPQLKKLIFTPLFYIALSFYFSSMLLYLTAISKLDISMAYPMVGLNYAIILITSKLFFKENVTPLRWFGVAFIILGVILISRS
jgi:multidrug transporter EmrE-like cation transporter